MIDVTPGAAIAAAWIGWLLSWLAAAVWTRRTKTRAGYLAEAPNRLFVLIGWLMVFGIVQLPTPLFAWSMPVSAGWALFLCVLAGFAFCWWARVHLGSLWSGSATLKEDHRIVDTGPYALVRHPIYTGALFSALATALYRGRIEAVIGAVLMMIGLWLQARLEERLLSRELGEAAYAGYSARVPMLIPFLKGRAA